MTGASRLGWQNSVCVLLLAGLPCSEAATADKLTPPVHDAMKPFVLQSTAYQHYVERFNAEDSDTTKLTIPNADAWSFLERNIPLFDCPDKQLEETYYYRWWCYRKHLTETPAGWVVTEFLPPVPWAGIYNTISCAAGHHLYEGRWLRDPRFVNDYARFWLLPEALPRTYTYWAADAVRAVTLASGRTRLAAELLPNLKANVQAWERGNRDANGLFHQEDGRDGMEFSLGGSGYRPSINSVMFGEAAAIADLARLCGDPSGEATYAAKAAELKRLVQQRLWNPHDGCFETVNPKSGAFCNFREEIGFIPWYFNLPDKGYESAWKQLFDREGFAAPFGPTTVERRAKGFMHPEDHDCLWNGPSWPYATTQTLVAMANLLNNREQDVVTARNYFDLLTQYARSQQKHGRPWVAEDLDADTGDWIVDLPRSPFYNHSGFADLVVTGLVGIRPRADDVLEVKPMVPKGTWKWFCLDGVPYHGSQVTVLWDEDGSHYGKGRGLTVFVNGKPVGHSEELAPITARIGALKMVADKTVRWDKHDGPVLGGKLGTCFDVCLLGDSGKFRMYFSWRPKKSIAVVDSEDGIHWSEPTILIGPRPTGWEDDINRPSVVKVGGKYHMWYTGQFNGHSAIGYATSADGLKWERHDKPVLAADQPWEKVAVMCPSVLWDAKAKQFRMWFSGGEQYEPDAIGYATSVDGLHWNKRPAPIFEADHASRWEQFKVTACQVLEWRGWHYMFYIGFRDIDHAQIGIARSRDGVTKWERLKNNPIVSPTVDGWDADACYKPFTLYDPAAKRWMLWFNGRHGGVEQIGLATRTGPRLGF